MQMTIYDAATVGSRSNCVYPNPVTVTDADTMRQAATFDHVCAAYKQNYRSVDNFLKADCLPMDCDNDHSDDPDDWLTPFDVAMDFPGVGDDLCLQQEPHEAKRQTRPQATVPCVFYLHGDNKFRDLQLMERQADCRLSLFR